MLFARAARLAEVRALENHRTELQEEFVKHPAMRIAAVLLLLATGCRGSDHLTAPDRALPTGPSFDVSAMDCELSPDQCQTIQRGINQLIAHQNPQCVSLGQQAQVRYDAPAGVEGSARAASSECTGC